MRKLIKNGGEYVMKNTMPVICMVILFGIANVIFGKVGLLGYIVIGVIGGVLGGFIGEKFFKEKEEDSTKKKFKFFKDISED
jgi:uncharacterized membrane protein YeaQ/YmgE (transglycosylase-associated protein family)